MGDPVPDPVELAIDHMAFKRRAAYKQRMRERKEAGIAPKPKPEIFQGDKWNASLRAELAKMQEQSNWLPGNAPVPAHSNEPGEHGGFANHEALRLS